MSARGWAGLRAAACEASPQPHPLPRKCSLQNERRARRTSEPWLQYSVRMQGGSVQMPMNLRHILGVFRGWHVGSRGGQAKGKAHKPRAQQRLQGLAAARPPVSCLAPGQAALTTRCWGAACEPSQKPPPAAAPSGRGGAPGWRSAPPPLRGSRQAGRLEWRWWRQGATLLHACMHACPKVDTQA